MANIKVSEMTEATVFDDGDYAMIVQANQNKKISKENMIGNIENNIGDLTDLETPDKTNLVNAINSNLPVVLYENSSGTDSSTIPLNDSASNYSKIEIYFGEASDYKFGLALQSVYNPNEKYINLFGFSVRNNTEIQLKGGTYYINNDTITRNISRAVTLETNSVTLWDSNVKIYKVLGYK